MLLLNKQAVSTDKEKSQHLYYLKLSILSIRITGSGKHLHGKLPFVSEGKDKLILHKSFRDPLRKAFFQLEFNTSTAVVCKKPDFPSCCLQTIAF